MSIIDKQNRYLDLFESLHINTKLFHKNFIFVDEISSGSFAHVLKVIDQISGDVCAVKVIDF